MYNEFSLVSVTACLIFNNLQHLIPPRIFSMLTSNIWQDIFQRPCMSSPGDQGHVPWKIRGKKWQTLQILYGNLTFTWWQNFAETTVGVVLTKDCNEAKIQNTKRMILHEPLNCSWNKPQAKGHVVYMKWVCDKSMAFATCHKIAHNGMCKMLQNRTNKPWHRWCDSPLTTCLFQQYMVLIDHEYS